MKGRKHHFQRTCPECDERFEAGKSVCPECGAVYKKAKEKKIQRRESRYWRHSYSMEASIGSGILTYFIDTIRFYFQRKALKRQREERARRKEEGQDGK